MLRLHRRLVVGLFVLAVCAAASGTRRRSGADAIPALTGRVITGWAAQQRFEAKLAANARFKGAFLTADEGWRQRGRVLRADLVTIIEVTRTRPNAEATWWSRLLALGNLAVPDVSAQAPDEIYITPWDSPEEIWNGNVYVYLGAEDADYWFNAEIDIVDPVNPVITNTWGLGGRVDEEGRTRYGRAAPRLETSVADRLLQAVVPAANAWFGFEDQCDCRRLRSDDPRGTMAACMLANALGQGGSICGVAAVACLRRGPAYLACVEEKCAVSIAGSLVLQAREVYNRCVRTR